MNHIRKFWAWFFSVPDEERSAGDIIIWWEKRRIPYNIIVGSVGICSLLLFYIFFAQSGQLDKLEPSEDAVEPIGLILAPIAINICYTAGWVVEICLSFIWSEKRSIGPILLKLGIGFSLLIAVFPSAFWGMYCLLQLVGLAER